MNSLRAHIKDGKDPRGLGKGKATGKGSKKAKNQPILDLDHYEDQDDLDEGDEGLMEKEKKFFDMLEMVLKKCQCCRPEKCCKIAKNGEHIEVTYQQ